MSRLRVSLLLACQLSLAASSARAQAQAPHDAKLTVTVVDQTGGVLPTATVTVTSQEPATPATKIAPAVASEKGVATFEGLTPGLYTLQGDMSQFETTIVKDVRLKLHQ